MKAAGELDRKLYVGGSDIAGILGLPNPGNLTPLTVYMKKRGELEGKMDPEKELFLKRRKRWEGPIIQMLKEEFDAEIVAINQRYRDAEYEFMAAEIDYEWLNAEGVTCNGEIKTSSEFAFKESLGWGEAGTDQVPDYVFAQCQWGMGITKAPECKPTAMIGLDRMVFYHLARDDETIAGMREQVRSFWVDNILASVPPDPSNHKDVMLMFAKRSGKPVELDDATYEALCSLRGIRASMKQFEDDDELITFKIEEFVCKQWGKTVEEIAKDNGELRYEGKVIATWNAGRGSHLDQKRLKADDPGLVARYTLPHYFRAFRFKKQS